MTTIDPIRVGATLADEPQEVAPGLHGVRLPLPFALNHVNLWLLEDGEGITVVDCGLADRRTRDFWVSMVRGFCRNRPIRRIIATHFHPDHMGIAGWLAGQTGASFWTTRMEWHLGRLLALDQSEAFVQALRAFDHAAGLTPEEIEGRAERGNMYAPRVAAPPPTYRRIQGEQTLQVGERRFEVIIGEGHSPEMALLSDPEAKILIAADQVLPRISPNVGVYPNEPLADPLAAYLHSTTALKRLAEDSLVLPSHGRPFLGLHRRIDELQRHHAERLEVTLGACAGPTTARQVQGVLFARDLDAHQFGFALGETVAHLNHLVGMGALIRERDPDGLWRYQRR